MMRPGQQAIVLLLLMLPSVFGEVNVVQFPFSSADTAWTFERAGPYQGWVDHRNLFVLHHPWSESEANRQGTVSRTVNIPSEWQAPVRLHFYMTDDYHGIHPRLGKEGWLGQIKLVGHRFKQVLVDGQVVWEQDVADPEGVAQPSRFTVPLPESAKPGDSIRLGFRLVDTIGSAKRSADDYRYIGTTDGIKESDPWKFMTHLYVGDVAISPAGSSSPTSPEPPAVIQTRALHAKRWPLVPFGKADRFPVDLQWEGWERIGPMTCVISCGLPLPAGRVSDAGQIILRDRTGRALPVQAEAMNTWPDGSLRWVRVDSIAPASESTRSVSLDIADKPHPVLPKTPVAVTEDHPERLVLVTGDMRITIDKTGHLLIRQMVDGKGVLGDMTAEVEVHGKAFRPFIERTRVMAGGPIRAEIESSGKLKSADADIGRFVFRLSAYAGQPYVRMTWRIFNDRPETLKIKRIELTGQCAFDSDAVSHWGREGKTGGADAYLRQLTEKHFDVVDTSGLTLDTGTSSAGWLALSDRSRTLQVAVRHFRQQFPKALQMKGGRLRIALFESSDDDPFYLPTEGEAKRHEIWIGLWNKQVPPGELTARAHGFARPARLFNADYACASGGLGQAAPHDEERFPAFHRILTELYGNIEASRFYVNHIRHWGDYPYGDNWCNGYYDAAQGMAGEYLMSGDPRWLDHLEATVRHVIDVDVCHASAAHPEWVGAKHCGECGPNHTSSPPWNAMQRIRGWLAYWRLTGDRDAREAALGVADTAVRAKRCIGNCSSVRDHAGVLDCLTAAYDETWEPRYLEAARKVAHDAMSRIDRRRGCYAEVHGNISYRGNVPWMCVQLSEPMYHYYRQSGDVDAAIAVVGLAESILTENRTRDVPGDVYGYSHNPHFKKTANYHVLIAPAILYAYELTGDEYYLTNARAMYRQMIREKNVNGMRNCYWLAPTLLYYLDRYGLEERRR